MYTEIIYRTIQPLQCPGKNKDLPGHARDIRRQIKNKLLLASKLRYKNSPGMYTEIIQRTIHPLQYTGKNKDICGKGKLLLCMGALLCLSCLSAFYFYSQCIQYAVGGHLTTHIIIVQERKKAQPEFFCMDILR